MMLRLPLLAVAATLVVNTGAICISGTNVFTVGVDLFASELGYFYFEECGEETNPTIGLEIGKTYTFVQADRSNYYHPLGFAYFPDGDHAGRSELEPSVSEGSSGCESDSTCPAPMYFSGDQYLGTYSNIPEVSDVTTGETDHGLDAYEPVFFYPIPEWAGSPVFSIQLKFDDETYEKDLFYFCHIHQFMSGRIKLLKNGVPINQSDDPPLGYEYDVPSAFDQSCGTFGLEEYQLPHPQCPETFVCGGNEDTFSTCLNAMNCKMFIGMSTGVKASSQVALFVHQMDPHHTQAVNMAKALLHTGSPSCADLTDDTDQDCIMEGMLREIVNNQNLQIQQMRGILERGGYPLTDPCTVEITSSNVS